MLANLGKRIRQRQCALPGVGSCRTRCSYCNVSIPDRISCTESSSVNIIVPPDITIVTYLLLQIQYRKYSLSMHLWNPAMYVETPMCDNMVL
jgi:hypothetical protein